MAFKLALKPTYKATVKVSLPNDRDGFDTHSFKAEFKRVDMDQLDDLQKKPQIDAIKEVIVGFSDLIDEDNNQVEFNEDNLEALLKIPQALAAVCEAFWGSIFKAKEKN